MAIALKDQRVDFTLVESSAKKAAFLRTVARELGLDMVTLSGPNRNRLIHVKHR